LAMLQTTETGHVTDQVYGDDVISNFVDISDARQEDSMGRQIIWYYPRIEVTE
jgi:hypothetical protein